MLRTTTGLSRSAARWSLQVAASVAASLVAAAIVQALPRAPAPPPEPAATAPELTSGGKFAARALVPGAADGLDTMPLPRIEAVTVIQPAFLLPPPARAAWDVPPPAAFAPSVPLRERAKPKPARAPLRVEARAVPAAGPVPAAVEAKAVPTEKGDDGLLHKVVSTTRDAWSLTASTGSALLSRLIP